MAFQRPGKIKSRCAIPKITEKMMFLDCLIDTKVCFDTIIIYELNV